MSPRKYPTDEQYQDELLNRLTRSDWARIVSREPLPSAGLEGITSEIKFADSTGHVSVRMPDYATGQAAALRLENPLDPNLPRIESHIGTRVAQAHAAIGRRHSTAYCQPVEHEVLLLTASIPTEYNPELVDKTIAALRQASIEADHCHNTVYSSLDQFISPGS